MRKSIDAYIKSVVHDNADDINGYKSIADYIIHEAENNTGYYEYFDEEELGDGYEPTESQIEELKDWLRKHYGMPIEREHTITDVMLTKHHNGSDFLSYKADGKTVEVWGEFYIDGGDRLHHTHIFDDAQEIEIVIPYENGEYSRI